MKFAKTLGMRVLTWALVIWIGTSFIFFIPRMFPSDPVEAMIAQMTAKSGSMEAAQKEALRSALRKQFGLEGTLWEQYTYFMWNGVLHFNFGPSLMNYPTACLDIIKTYLPYTLMLSLTGSILGWCVGNVIGLLAGFRPNKRSSKIMETIAICIYPIPYFIVALVIQIVFAFLLGWFPIQATIMTNGTTGQWFASLVRSSFLPLMSGLLVGTGWWIISMKALSSTVASEDYVHYARYRGMSEGRIGFAYVFRNCILTQVTALAMQLGGAFNGNLMVEIIYSYPGVGKLVQNAILQSDYNMIQATITISIIAIATCTLVADLVYPFIDPRIRYA